MRPRPSRLPIALAATFVLVMGAAVTARARGASPDSTAQSAADSLEAAGAAADSSAPPRPATQSDARDYALRLGFENVRSEHNSTERVAYENRRYRHSMDAYGQLTRGGRDLIAYELRLGLTAAQIRRHPENGRLEVGYPSDWGFLGPPRGPRSRPTSNSFDLFVGPLFAYDLGRLTSPVQVQLQTEVTARYNPWPGGRATASIVLPMYNDFSVSDDHPDVENVRPGIVTLEQFTWIPRVALLSGTAGVFADNRYGVSFGIARPLYQGAVLLDAQADLTGFVAFNEDGIRYSTASQSSAFGGVTWRPPWWDVALRARYAKFLYGDRGAEFAMTRSFGDFDLVLSLVRAKDQSIEGIRVVFPVPPLTRPTRAPLRALPVERFPINFRTDATPIGQTLVGVASREEFLRHLNRPTLENNRFRQDRAQGRAPQTRDQSPILWTNHSGMTGFVMTPWAGVQAESNVEVGFTSVPRKWAYNPAGIPRGVYYNEIYYASLGLLRRLEAGIRITRTPGFNALAGIDPESELSTDTDHMASFRLALLEPRDGVPGLAVGVEDLQGTRRYHAAYVVAGMPASIFHVQNRFSLGYASRVFTASRRVLDGAFGAIEVSPWRAVAARFEYDTEKFNVGLGVDLGFGLRIRAAALNMESLSAGVGWHHKL